MTQATVETDRQVRGMKAGVPINELYSTLKEQVAMKKDFTASQSGLKIGLEREPTEAQLAATWQPQSDLDELLSKVDLEGESNETPILDAVLANDALMQDLPGEEANGREIIPQINLEGIGTFPMTNLFHRQLASHLKIPKAYYDRLLDGDPKWTPEQIEETKEQRHKLLVENLNTWLNIRAADMRLVRTMGGRARAYMSNAYRCIDNFDIATAVLSEILKLNSEHDMGIYCASANVTEDYMHLKFTTEKLQAMIRPGNHSKADDVVQAGLVVKNSEVGLSSIRIEPMIVRLICWNGAVMAVAINKRHVGSRNKLGDSNVEELLTDATKKLDDQALMAKVRDVVSGSLKEDLFYGNVELLKKADGRPLDYKGEDVRVKPVIKELSKRHSFSDKEADNILDSYMKTIEDTGQTQWGLGNAVTLAAGRSKSYDRASEMERVGGGILKLDDTQWESLMRSAS